MQGETEPLGQRSWWAPRRRFSVAELIADGIVHGVGIVAAIAVGAVVLALAIAKTAPAEAPALAIYIGSLVALLSVSLAYNLWPVSPIKRILARLDQAAIFLFIAGTYTPFLAIMGGSTTGVMAQNTTPQGEAPVLDAGDQLTGERYGQRVAELTLKLS